MACSACSWLHLECYRVECNQAEYPELDVCLEKLTAQHDEWVRDCAGTRGGFPCRTFETEGKSVIALDELVQPAAISVDNRLGSELLAVDVYGNLSNKNSTYYSGASSLSPPFFPSSFFLLPSYFCRSFKICVIYFPFPSY